MASQSDITFCCCPASATALVSLQDSAADHDADRDSDSESVLSDIIPMRSSVVVFTLRRPASRADAQSKGSAEETQSGGDAARRSETADTEPIPDQQEPKRARDRL